MNLGRSKKKHRLLRVFIFTSTLIFIRFTKGALFTDVFSYISRPFWPGPSQKYWIESSVKLENLAKISLLEKDNERLRGILSLHNSSIGNFISAAVISRSYKGWWQQVVLSKGKRHGIKVGNPVKGPGGLLGVVQSVTPVTSQVRLLTAPGSKVGVWLPRAKKHGVLIGVGTNRPYINFLDKNPNVTPGDLVSTSPASTLMPPNIPVGIIQSINKNFIPSPRGIVQLLASPEAIDWVQVKVN